MKFEQIFKGELPKFDVSFGRGKFSKLNQLNISKSSQSVNKLCNSNIISKSNSSTCIINSSINRLNNNNNNKSQIQQQQQRKSLNTSASAKLSS